MVHDRVLYYFSAQPQQTQDHLSLRGATLKKLKESMRSAGQAKQHIYYLRISNFYLRKQTNKQNKPQTKKKPQQPTNQKKSPKTYQKNAGPLLTNFAGTNRREERLKAQGQSDTEPTEHGHQKAVINHNQ